MIRPGTTQLFYPLSKYGVIYLEEGEQIELYCSTSFSTPYEAGTTFLATCSHDNQFSFNGVNYDFSSFYCKGFTASEVRKTSERCYNNGYVVQHGFPVGSKFVNIYEACHNDVREETYYVKHHFTPANAGFQTGYFDVFIREVNHVLLINSCSGYARPNFVTGGLFGGKDVDKLYTRATQRVTISEIIGSYDLAQKYIEETSDVFLGE